MKAIQVGERYISPEHPCFIIAEAGVNHNGSLATALELVDAAAEANADAVKFQTFRADALVTKSAPKAAYQVTQTSPGESQYEMLRKLELTEEAHRQIAAHCTRRGILFLSSAFDEESADLLARLEMPAYKLGSGEITNLGLLEHIARLGKPVLLSTGMCGLTEVEAAVKTLEGAGMDNIALLHCVSEYPANPTDVNLRAMHTLSAAFGVPVGYSDHVFGTEVTLAAVALGACVIERHLTLSRQMPGPDHAASSEPAEFKAMVESIRRIEAALGDGRKRPSPGEMKTAAVARKSLVAASDIEAGTVLEKHMLAVRRPGTGLPASFLPYLLGRSAKSVIRNGEVISLDMLR